MMDPMHSPTACSLCRACEGSAYQTVPMLAAGTLRATKRPILIIAQNPGEIRADDRIRHVMTRMQPATDEGLDLWYSIDFGTSPAAAKMGQVFGEDFVLNPDFVYTNAVRCRTRANATPSDEMITNCIVWTKGLIAMHKPRGIVLLGRVAVAQLLGEKEGELPVMTMRKHPTYGPMLALPHHVKWDTTNTPRIQKLFAEFMAKI